MKMMGPDSPCDGGNRMAALSSERLRRPSAGPDGSTTSLRKRIRIHPEAQRILGNSFIPIVCLERLKVPAVPGQIGPSTSLKPMVTLTRSPCQPHLKSLLVNSPQQNGSNLNTLDIENPTNASPPARPPVPLNPNPCDATSWWSPTALYCSPLAAQESSLHSHTHHNTPCTQSSWDHLAIAETTELELLHLAFDPEQDMVIQVDPDGESPALEGDPDQDVLLVLEDDALPEAEVLSRHLVEEAGDQRDCSLTPQGAVGSTPPDTVLSIKQGAVGSTPPHAVLSIKQGAVGSTPPDAVLSIKQGAVGSTPPDTVLSIKQGAVGSTPPHAVLSIKQGAVGSTPPDTVLSIKQGAVGSTPPDTVLSIKQGAVGSTPPDAVLSIKQGAVGSTPPDTVLSIKQGAVGSTPPHAVLSIKQGAVGSRQPEAVVSRQQDAVVSRQPSDGQMESDDFCAVCLIGGELLCCDRCPKVFHLSCHVPSLVTFPTGDWLCTLCRSDQDPAEVYGCESPPSSGEKRAPYSLSTRDQRRCEKLTLLLLCQLLSAPFQQAVSPLARNYYQIIRRPMDLSLIRRKLDKSNTLHYFTPQHFVDDVLLMFRNCATFNYPDSEVARAGRDLEVLFLEQLRLVFSDQNFPAASQEGTKQAGLHWLNRKRKETYRKKNKVLGGKKYFL